jgi:hypothetical protein
MLCTAEQYVDAICGPEKSYSLLLITPHERDDYNLAFLSLKIVHGRNTKQITQFLLF